MESCLWWSGDIVVVGRDVSDGPSCYRSWIGMEWR